MGEKLIAGLAIMGLVVPLLPLWRPVLIALALFALGNGLLLHHIWEFLNAEPNPGPGARAGVIFAFAPTVVFAASCMLRFAFVVFKCATLRVRNRAVREANWHT